MNTFGRTKDEQDGMRPTFSYSMGTIRSNVYRSPTISGLTRKQYRRLQIEKEEEALVKKIPDSEIEHAAKNQLPLNKYSVKRLRLYFKSIGSEPKVYNQTKNELIGLLYSLFGSSDKIAGESTCGICLDEKVQLQILNPCGHGFCSICSRKLNKCPTCRVDIQSVIRPFVS